jgi:hypothetical protein
MPRGSTMTAQFGEVLILNGDQTSMAFCPPLPSDHARLKVLTQEEIATLVQRASEEQKAKGEEVPITRLDMILGSTACWRWRDRHPLSGAALPERAGIDARTASHRLFGHRGHPMSPSRRSKQHAVRLVCRCARKRGGVGSTHPRATWGMSEGNLDVSS